MTADPTVIQAKLQDGREVPCHMCDCAHCKNDFFVPGYSEEWMPNFCPFCGIKFIRKTTYGEPGEFKPKPTAVEECLTQWLSPENEEAAKTIIGDCPREVLQMVAVLRELETTTRDHEADLAADGWIFRTEEAEQRADGYGASVRSLVEIWGEPEPPDDSDDETE